jgi:uncharacterized membrane protein
MTPEPPSHPATEFTTQRLEALSDGVFAIAITLLILEIRIPETGEGSHVGSLAAALLHIWPSYFAYILSFLMIGIYWANHHYLYKLYRKTDHYFNLLNVFFLMCISFLPFPTALLGRYINNPTEQHTAASFYAFGLLLPAFSWFLLWLYASHNYRLIDPNLDPSFVKYLNRQYILSNILYSSALLVSFLSPNVAIAICVGLTLLYMLPPKTPIYRTQTESPPEPLPTHAHLRKA